MSVEEGELEGVEATGRSTSMAGRSARVSVLAPMVIAGVAGEGAGGALGVLVVAEGVRGGEERVAGGVSTTARREFSTLASPANNSSFPLVGPTSVVAGWRRTAQCVFGVHRGD